MLTQWWPFRRRQNTVQSTGRWDLSTPIIRLPCGESISLGRALCGVFIAGQTGSAKTTSSGSLVSESLLRTGFGGLVLSVKHERPMWERLCRDTNREDDLVIFDSSGELRFNPIDFEVRRKGAGAGLTENILQFLMTLLDVGGRSSGRSDGRDDSAYWKNACKQMLRAAIDLLILATGGVNIPDLYRVIISAAGSREEVLSEAWRSQSFNFQCLNEADKRVTTGRERRDLKLVADYFLGEFPALSEKTRSIIVSTFTSLIDCMQRGVLRDLFCEDSTITPDAIEAGKIVVIDIPIQEFGQVGLIANLVWKLAFQRSIERRAVTNDTRPVFLWADEGHFFLHEDDSLFQSTCRGARVASVLITQNIPNLDVALSGGDAGRAQAESLLANFGTLIFHCNTCSRTNEFASGLIGRTVQILANGHTSHQPEDWTMAALGLSRTPQTSGGFSEHWEYAVQPAEFTRLRTGGAGCWEADAIVVQSGTTFRDTGRIWAPMTFRQKI